VGESVYKTFVKASMLSRLILMCCLLGTVLGCGTESSVTSTFKSEITKESSVTSTFKSEITKNLQDPKSAEFDELKVKKVTLPTVAKCGSGANGYYVTSIVRAKNSFGGVVPSPHVGFFDESGNKLYIGCVDLDGLFRGMSSEDVDTLSDWFDKNEDW
jgi:hypothetical protein